MNADTTELLERPIKGVLTEAVRSAGSPGSPAPTPPRGGCAPCAC